MLPSFFYKLGRRLYMQARCDLPNKPETNGEYWLLSKTMNSVPKGAIFMDIGANKGDWTETVLSEAKNQGLNVRIKAFEPSSQTRKLLYNRFSGHPLVDVYDTAVSNIVGSTTFYQKYPGAGTNSLHPISGDHEETVKVTTMDAFIAENNIEHVSFAKIDVEGFDYFVLDGATKSLENGSIDLLQFEYNWRWILNSQNLRNVFKKIEKLPYIFGKLAGNKILIFDRWHFELDRFFEGNYVLIRKNSPFEFLGTKAYFDSSNSIKY